MATTIATAIAGLICHNDAGSQFTSIAYTDTVAGLDAHASIGTVGDSYDCEDPVVGVRPSLAGSGLSLSRVA
jgi:hypothetical protein